MTFPSSFRTSMPPVSIWHSNLPFGVSAQPPLGSGPKDGAGEVAVRKTKANVVEIISPSGGACRRRCRSGERGVSHARAYAWPIGNENGERCMSRMDYDAELQRHDQVRSPTSGERCVPAGDS